MYTIPHYQRDRTLAKYRPPEIDQVKLDSPDLATRVRDGPPYRFFWGADFGFPGNKPKSSGIVLRAPKAVLFIFLTYDWFYVRVT